MSGNFMRDLATSVLILTSMFVAVGVPFVLIVFVREWWLAPILIVWGAFWVTVAMRWIDG